MKVSFRQSGGFSGLTRGCDLDTDLMAQPEGEELEQLVAAGVSVAPAAVSRSLRDGMAYEITVDAGGEIRRMRFEDTAIPAPVEPLLSFLGERSGPLKA